jgi:glycosyl hydrolase family 64 (putative beta-1,3-glucanase)
VRVALKPWFAYIAAATVLCACVSHGSSILPASSNAWRAAGSRPAAVPAYCNGFAAAKGNAHSAPQKVQFFDRNASLGAQLYLYLVTGYDQGAGGHQYLTKAGTLATFKAGVDAPAIPLVCFPGSIGANGKGLTFALPPPTTALTSGNLYLVYATPRPGGGIPNPLPFKGTGTGSYAAPATDWNSSAFVDLPYDYIEYTLPNGITDVTQVNKVGLPLQLQQGKEVIGFASGAKYKALLDGILAAKPLWNKLAFSSVVNKHKVLGGILATQNGGVWGFPQDYMYTGKYTGKPGPSGYVGFVLNQYKASPRAYTTKFLIDVPTKTFCASSDGTANVLFYTVPGPAACKQPLKNPTYTMPIWNTLKGTGVVDSGICQSAIFAMPYGGPGAIFKDQTEFYLWKAMVIDFNRGAILSDSMHPIGTWQTDFPAGKRPPFNIFYQEPQDSKYSKLVHTYMINNLSYALAYDEPGGYGPTFTSQPSQVLKVTIQEIPPFAAPVPKVVPTPLPCPKS